MGQPRARPFGWVGAVHGVRKYTCRSRGRAGGAGVALLSAIWLGREVPVLPALLPNLSPWVSTLSRAVPLTSVQ